MSRLPESVRLWNRLLDERREHYVADAPRFRQTVMDAGVCFGDRPLCNHLRPKFLTEKELVDLKSVSEAVLEAIMAVQDRLATDPTFQARVGLREEERHLVEIDPGYSHIAPCVRLDSFITEAGPQFVELNGECPAGPAYVEVLSRHFRDHELGKRFAEDCAMRWETPFEPLLETLLGCYEEWGKGTGKPTIAVVDYDGLPTRHEFELCRRMFEERGYTTVVCDPRRLEYDGRRLVAEGKPVDLVYRRVLINEFLERFDQVKALYEATRDGNVCMVNPFRSKLVHKKAIFAILTADDRDDWVDARTAALIDRAVPWTRLLEDGKTIVDGETVDLLAWTLAHRDELVLKPNDEYGGKGITLGWEVDAATWETAVREAVGDDYVVQRRLYLIPESFPAMDTGLAEADLFVDLDPYMYRGKMHGALARLGAGGLCNVTSGGGQVPLMIVP